MWVDKMSAVNPLENQESPFIYPGGFLITKGHRNLPENEAGKAEECWLEGHFGNTFKMESCDFLRYG